MGDDIVKDWLMQNGLAVVFTLITTGLLAAIRHLWQRQKCQTAEQVAIKDGMLALLHDRIYTAYETAAERESVTVEELRNIEYLYKPYHDLGGNGTGTELYNRICKMPVNPAERRSTS